MLLGTFGVCGCLALPIAIKLLVKGVWKTDIICYSKILALKSDAK